MTTYVNLREFTSVRIKEKRPVEHDAEIGLEGRGKSLGNDMIIIGIGERGKCMYESLSI